jgi:hypothetical protein
MKATKFKPHVALHSPKCMRRAAGLLVTHVLKVYEINHESFLSILAVWTEISCLTGRRMHTASLT